MQSLQWSLLFTSVPLGNDDSRYRKVYYDLVMSDELSSGPCKTLSAKVTFNPDKNVVICNWLFILEVTEEQRLLWPLYKSGWKALQMKCQWESNINVWFPFMYFQKFPKKNDNVLSPHFLHSYIFERFIYFQDRSAYSAVGKYVDGSWEYINRSHTHECGNWDWGCAIPRKGIHKWDFCWSEVGWKKE